MELLCFGLLQNGHPQTREEQGQASGAASSKSALTPPMRRMDGGVFLLILPGRTSASRPRPTTAMERFTYRLPYPGQTSTGTTLPSHTLPQIRRCIWTATWLPTDWPSATGLDRMCGPMAFILVQTTQGSTKRTG